MSAATAAASAGIRIEPYTQSGVEASCWRLKPKRMTGIETGNSRAIKPHTRAPSARRSFVMDRFYQSARRKPILSKDGSAPWISDFRQRADSGARVTRLVLQLHQLGRDAAL